MRMVLQSSRESPGRACRVADEQDEDILRCRDRIDLVVDRVLDGLRLADDDADAWRVEALKLPATGCRRRTGLFRREADEVPVRLVDLDVRIREGLPTEIHRAVAPVV